MEDLVEQAITYAADELSSYAFAAGIDAVRVGLRHMVLGEPAERAMRAVFSRAVARMLREMRDAAEAEGSVLDVESVEVARDLLGELFSDAEAAGALLRVAVSLEPVPLDALRGRFS
jgi:Rod binding domain-containing protein